MNEILVKTKNVQHLIIRVIFEADIKRFGFEVNEVINGKEENCFGSFGFFTNADKCMSEGMNSANKWLTRIRNK